MNTTILHWLLDWGVPVLAHEYLYWIITISCIALVIYMVDLIFRRVLLPAVPKVTNKTNFEWDEIMLSDSML